jgi:MOSC N-terminal beta barrel domain
VILESRAICPLTENAGPSRLRIMTIAITKLFLYPIKSCRGILVSSAEVTPLGFKNDRAYMLAEVRPPKPDKADGLKIEKWIPMTLHEHPRVPFVTIIN